MYFQCGKKTIQSAGFNNVVVFYNDQPYQWLVKHVDKEEVYVWYMQSVGREIDIPNIIGQNVCLLSVGTERMMLCV